MKMSGAEFKLYYKDPAFWPEGLWHEDEQIKIDGEDVPENDIDLGAVSDECVVEIKAGILLMPHGQECPFADMSMDAHMRAWMRKQTTRYLVVRVDMKKLDAVVAAVKAAGGKIDA